MKWVDRIVEQLTPAFGGIATFCEDPDDLLEIPVVREALCANGLTIGDWSGSSESILGLSDLGEDDMPLLLVGGGGAKHIVEETLRDFRWEKVSIGDLMPNYFHEFVQRTPPELWDALYELHSEQIRPLGRRDTALLFGRALYGLDPLALSTPTSWLRVLTRLALDGDAIPLDLAEALGGVMEAPASLGTLRPIDMLGDPVSARSALAASWQMMRVHSALRPTDQILSAALQSLPSGAPRQEIPGGTMEKGWRSTNGDYAQVAAFAEVYAESTIAAHLPESEWGVVNGLFQQWLIANYGHVMASTGQAILPQSKILAHLDAEVGEGRAVLIIVDGLGLAAWNLVKRHWTAQGIISRDETKVVLSVVPTLTMFGRRAIFEERLPSQFSSGDHSQRLERLLWTRRFGPDGKYLTSVETVGARDAFATGRPRICIVDTAWDHLGHAINPPYSSIAGTADSWATHTPLSDTIQQALAHGYRVFITADHGQIECTGMGRLDTGATSEQRSKRVALFKTNLEAAAHATSDLSTFRPYGSAPDSFAVFAPGRSSFDLVGVSMVSHGGMSPEEVMVPFAEVFE